MSNINNKVIMSGADFFDVVPLNSYSHNIAPVVRDNAIAETQSIRDALQASGVDVIKVDAPVFCQDAVYTANWALVRGDTAILASLPGPRKAEEAYAEKVLAGQGLTVIKAPYRFSGQGDALPCGNYLFAGTTYRTDERMHQFVADTLGYDVISLQTIPERDASGNPIINALSGWPDSFFYDIDLAISVLHENLITWCPEAFEPESQAKIRALPLDKIEVSFAEATQSFACNLISTGQTVVMSATAPELKANIEAKGLKVITPHVSELAKGGGYIRCTTLTLN